jgi:hypothetical protein
MKKLKVKVNLQLKITNNCIKKLLNFNKKYYNSKITI